MLLEHPEMINSIGEKARDLVSNYYDNKIITKNLIEFYKEVM